jgi:hypothetical protein
MPERLKQLFREGKSRGYVLYDEIDALVPEGYWEAPT